MKKGFALVFKNIRTGRKERKIMPSRCGFGAGKATAFVRSTNMVI